MRSYIDRMPVVASVAATVAVVSMSWLACAGTAQVDLVSDDVLTAEQCIDAHSAKGSIAPFEDALVAEDIVGTDLDKLSITRGMCEEIIERTPGGTPVERAAAVGNLIRELEIIETSMEDAADEDINGDGRVDAEDTKIAAAASYAASQAAQETVRRATEQGSTTGGAPEELNAVPAAYLAQQKTTASGSATTSATASASGSASASDSATASGSASASATATASATAGAGEDRSAGGDRSAGLPSHKEAQTNASSAAREKGADSKAAAGGGQCAATVALTDATLHVLRGSMSFQAPATEMHWKDHDRAQLVVAPKALRSIEQLEQEVAQAEGAGRVEADCLHLGDQMEPKIVSDQGLGIRWFDERRQSVRRDVSITWRWDVVASQRGTHPLFLNITQYVSTSKGESSRSFEDSPFTGSVFVSATRWEVLMDFVERRWPLLVPIFLTILTAIIIPLVVSWWKRRNQPSEPAARPDHSRDNRWI